MEFRTLAEGLQFPEGPVALADGSVLLVEIAAGTLTRIAPDGSRSVAANTGGGPNGAAVGPDGKGYVANNGGFEWHREGGHIRPLTQAKGYRGGRIERVDLATGAVECLYRACGEVPLKGPNDLVIDAHGGIYFTDLGKRRPREMDIGAVYYGKPDGSSIVEVAYPMVTPNGIGLSPDEKTLYVADGRICVATLVNGGITVISPDGRHVEHHPMPDLMTTNICFGGPDMKTAYITLSWTGRLVAVDWPTPGLKLNQAG